MGKGPRKQLAATRSNTLPPRLVKKTSENKQAVPSEMKSVTKIVAPSRDITNARSKFIRLAAGLAQVFVDGFTPEWAMETAITNKGSKQSQNSTQVPDDLKAFVCGIKKMGNPSKVEIARVGESISLAELKSIGAEHEKKMTEYSKAFESFVRSLNSEDLNSFKIVTRHRRQMKEMAKK